MTLHKNDHRAFAQAIETGDVDTVEALLTAHPALANAPEWTPPPIHCAVLWNQPQIVEQLLDHGADIETLDPDRKTTPLRYAIMYCKVDAISVLLSRGANTGPIVEDGKSAVELAEEAAGGAYEEYADLPSQDEYKKLLEWLRESV